MSPLTEYFAQYFPDGQDPSAIATREDASRGWVVDRDRRRGLLVKSRVHTSKHREAGVGQRMRMWEVISAQELASYDMQRNPKYGVPMQLGVAYLEEDCDVFRPARHAKVSAAQRFIRTVSRRGRVAPQPQREGGARASRASSTDEGRYSSSGTSLARKSWLRSPMASPSWTPTSSPPQTPVFASPPMSRAMSPVTGGVDV